MSISYTIKTGLQYHIYGLRKEFIKINNFPVNHINNKYDITVSSIRDLGINKHTLIYIIKDSNLFDLYCICNSLKYCNEIADDKSFTKDLHNYCIELDNFINTHSKKIDVEYNNKITELNKIKKYNEILSNSKE